MEISANEQTFAVVAKSSRRHPRPFTLKIQGTASRIELAGLSVENLERLRDMIEDALEYPDCV